MNPEATNQPTHPAPAMPVIPVGKKVERPDDDNSNDAPTLEDLIPLQVYSVNPTAVSELYDRASRPAPEGEINRKNLTFTITPQTDDEWRDFLKTHTGTLPQRGKGISSPMVELSMQLLMAVVASFKLNELAVSLMEVSGSNEARQQLKVNLVNLAEQL